MDAFINAITWRYSAFLKTGNGNYWRVWFEGFEPRMEKLTAWQVEEYKEALSKLNATL